MPTAQRARTETWRPTRRARSRAHTLPRAANIGCTLAIPLQCGNARAPLPGRRHPRRSTHSPTHSGHPVTPSAGLRMDGHGAARERPRERALERRAAHVSESAEQVAARTGSSPRAAASRAWAAGASRPPGDAARADAAPRARDDAEHALGRDRALAGQHRDHIGALVAERGGVAEREVDRAAAEERAQRGRVASRGAAAGARARTTRARRRRARRARARTDRRCRGSAPPRRASSGESGSAARAAPPRENSTRRLAGGRSPKTERRARSSCGLHRYGTARSPPDGIAHDIAQAARHVAEAVARCVSSISARRPDAISGAGLVTAQLDEVGARAGSGARRQRRHDLHAGSPSSPRPRPAPARGTPRAPRPAAPEARRGARRAPAARRWRAPPQRSAEPGRAGPSA